MVTATLIKPVPLKSGKMTIMLETNMTTDILIEVAPLIGQQIQILKVPAEQEELMPDIITAYQNIISVLERQEVEIKNMKHHVQALIEKISLTRE